jgi:hypothetical protein
MGKALICALVVALAAGFFAWRHESGSPPTRPHVSATAVAYRAAEARCHAAYSSFATRVSTAIAKRTIPPAMPTIAQDYPSGATAHAWRAGCDAGRAEAGVSIDNLNRVNIKEPGGVITVATIQSAIPAGVAASLLQHYLQTHGSQ